MSAVFDCHGNWSAAVALMDKACLPRPPLTLTRVLQVRAPKEYCWIHSSRSAYQ